MVGGQLSVRCIRQRQPTTGYGLLTPDHAKPLSSSYPA
jgi:hypothetical protein